MPDEVEPTCFFPLNDIFHFLFRSDFFSKYLYIPGKLNLGFPKRLNIRGPKEMYQNTLFPNEEEKGEEHTFVFDLGAFRKLYVCMYVTGGDED